MSPVEEGKNGVLVTATKTNKNQQQKPELLEIHAIGYFLLGLYHVQLISPRNDWKIKKNQMRQEYLQYLQNLKDEGLKAKLAAAAVGESEENVIGKLLHRTKYLINTPRGSEYYRINNRELFAYRNMRLENMEKNQLNSKRNVCELEGCIIGEAINEHSKSNTAVRFRVDPMAETYPLLYVGNTNAQRKTDFNLKNKGCYICQTNFETQSEKEKHMEYHGDESNFEYSKTLNKIKVPYFEMSYKLCKYSPYFCFTLKSWKPNIVIEKIMLVQPHAMCYIHNQRVPYTLDGTETFFLDSQLFTIFMEQPFFIAFHYQDKSELLIEQHNFLRVHEFPKSLLRLPKRAQFKVKTWPESYLPSLEVRIAVREGFSLTNLSKLSNDFNEYLQNNKILTRSNFTTVMRTLLEIEDMEKIREYQTLVQRNIQLCNIAGNYALKPAKSKNAYFENTLSQHDEVVVYEENKFKTYESMIFYLLLDTHSSVKKLELDRYGAKEGTFGVVESVCNGRVTFSCKSKLPLEQRYAVVFRPSRMPFRYQYQALEKTSYTTSQMSADVKRLLFPSISADLMSYKLSECIREEDLYNKSIWKNPEQFEAVQNIACRLRKDVPYIIFGPPGTGKTTTVVESVLQLYFKYPKSKILITAGSNTACDELALRLCNVLPDQKNPRAIARIFSKSNDKKLENIDELLLEFSNMYDGNHFYPDVSILHEFRIVVCTLSMIGKLASGDFGKTSIYSKPNVFTHLFIDEVAASTETEVLVALTATQPYTSVIISGDHKQLGAVLQSNNAASMGFEISLMERLLEQFDCYRVDENGDYDRRIQTRLSRNYRSHPQIVNLYSNMFYNNKLIPLADPEATSFICKNWHGSPNPDYPIMFHSVFGKSTQDKHSTSFYNNLELEIVMNYVKDFMYFGVNGRKIEESDIGIISPYKKQYLRIQDELSQRNWYGIEVGSVETFQGKEKPIIIVSFVRSFLPTLGFLESERRLNVTISRPKSFLILIGNPQTLSSNPCYEHIIKECQRNKTLVGTRYRDVSEVDTKSLTVAMDGLNLNQQTTTNNKQKKANNRQNNRNNSNNQNNNNNNNNKNKQNSNNSNQNNKNSQNYKSGTQNQQRNNNEKGQEGNQDDDDGSSNFSEDSCLFDLPAPPKDESFAKTMSQTQIFEKPITDFEHLEKEVHERLVRLGYRQAPTAPLDLEETQNIKISNNALYNDKSQHLYPSKELQDLKNASKGETSKPNSSKNIKLQYPSRELKDIREQSKNPTKKPQISCGAILKDTIKEPKKDTNQPVQDYRRLNEHFLRKFLREQKLTLTEYDFALYNSEVERFFQYYHNKTMDESHLISAIKGLSNTEHIPSTSSFSQPKTQPQARPQTSSAQSTAHTSGHHQYQKVPNQQQHQRYVPDPRNNVYEHRGTEEPKKKAKDKCSIS